MQRSTYSRFFTTSMVVIAALAIASPAVSTARAQADRTPGQSNQAPAEQTPDITEQKLDAAATAIKQIASVKADYEKKIDEAPQADRERMTDEAENAMVKAVTDTGLSVKEYQSIMVVAQNNPEVRQKLIRKIRPAD